MSLFVYLHGFASGPGSTKARFFRDRFAGRGVELVAPDLAGGDFEHLTLTGQLRVVEEVAQGRPLSLIGSSLGGYLAALYAARHAEVARLVLLAPGFGFARRWPRALGEETLAAWRREGWLTLYHYGDKKDRRLHFGLIEDGERYEDYPEVTQPALVFHGRNDTVVPYQVSLDFAARSPRARVEILESGHELTDVLEHLWEETARFLLV